MLLAVTVRPQRRSRARTDPHICAAPNGPTSAVERRQENHRNVCPQTASSVACLHQPRMHLSSAKAQPLPDAVLLATASETPVPGLTNGARRGSSVRLFDPCAAAIPRWCRSWADSGGGGGSVLGVEEFHRLVAVRVRHRLERPRAFLGFVVERQQPEAVFQLGESGTGGRCRGSPTTYANSRPPRPPRG